MCFKCNLCKHKNYKVITDSHTIRFKCFGHDKKIIQCSNCELVQLFPFWKPEELEVLYDNYNSKSDFKGQKKKKNINYYIEDYMNKSDRILEIGASRGDDLFYFKENEYDIMGIDKDSSVCDGLNIFNMDIKDLHVQPFDFIYGIHLFEHIDDPISFIKEVYRLLKPGGRFLFEMPNVDDPLLTLYKNKAYGKFYWYPFHLFFYNQKTLNKLFSKFDYSFNMKIWLKQRYGIINHLRWIFCGRPGSFNPRIPLIDGIYERFLQLYKVSDTIVVTGRKNG